MKADRHPGETDWRAVGAAMLMVVAILGGPLLLAFLIAVVLRGWVG